MADKDVSRRTFVKSTAGAAAVAAMAAPTFVPKKVFGANDQIRIAVLGMHGRGKSHVNGYEKLDNVQVVTMCDPDMRVLRERNKQFGEKYNKKYHLEQDLRKVFDDKDIDAVSIATCNHWHALATIWACQAGKDVYVEKPGSHNIFEGRKMVEAAAKYDRIVQHGVQLRSSKAIKEVVQAMRDGIIGRVYMARGLVYRWRGDIGKKGFSTPPDDLDYNLWLGPAQYQPYSEDWVHYNWHWLWNWGTGEALNNGTHMIDLLRWGFGVNYPIRVSSNGGRYHYNDDWEAPDTQVISFDFKEGISMYYQNYIHPRYSQKFGDFISHLSVIDLLFNCGPESRKILLSGSINKDELIKNVENNPGPHRIEL